MLILVDLFNKLNMIQINQIWKRKLVTQTQKFLIIVELLKKQIIMLKLLKWNPNTLYYFISY